MLIETPTELIAAVNDGRLTILDRPRFLDEATCQLLHQANAGDVNAAIALYGVLCSLRWVWHLGYDNRAVLTKRDDPATTISEISLNPGHALALGVLKAAFSQPLA